MSCVKLLNHDEAKEVDAIEVESLLSWVGVLDNDDVKEGNVPIGLEEGLSGEQRYLRWQSG